MSDNSFRSFRRSRPLPMWLRIAALAPSPSPRRVVECGKVRNIHAFALAGDGKSLGPSKVLVDAGAGTPDGFRLDVEGNLWCGWGMGSEALDGVRVFSPEGEPLGHIRLPERCANVCFGGVKRNRLFMAASHGLYSLYVNARGL